MGEIFTIDEVAKRLKLTPDTVRDWSLKGKLRASKLGRIWRIDAVVLEELMRGTTPEASAMPTPSIVETPQARKAALLARLRALKAEGLSSQQIATQLNREGVPTMSGGGQWQQGTVANLLTQAEGARC